MTVPHVFVDGDKPTHTQFNENFQALCDLVAGSGLNADVVAEITGDLGALQDSAGSLLSKCEALEERVTMLEAGA